MSTYDYSAVFYDGGCLQVDGCSYNCTASHSTPGSASAEVYTLQNCAVYPMISQALSVIDLAIQAEAAVPRFGIVDNADVQSIVYDTTYSCFLGLRVSLGHLITGDWGSIYSLMNTIFLTAIFLIQQRVHHLEKQLQTSDQPTDRLTCIKAMLDEDWAKSRLWTTKTSHFSAP